MTSKYMSFDVINPTRHTREVKPTPDDVFLSVLGTSGYLKASESINKAVNNTERIMQALEKLTFKSQFEEKSWCVNLPPLPFTSENRKIVFDHLFCTPLREGGLGKFREWNIWAKEPIRSHLRRLYLSLDGYFESSNPVMSFQRIAELVLMGPDGIRDCKRIRTKSLVLGHRGARMYEKPVWWDEVEAYYCEQDIGDIFNYLYLLDWELPDEEDWKHGLEPVSIEKQYLDEFKEALRNELPERDEFKKIDPEEILLGQSSSTSYFSDLENKSYQWIIQGTEGGFSNRPLKGRRALLHTQTGSARDTVILPVDQSNSVKLIDRQIKQIIAHMRGNAMFDDPIKIEELLLADRKKYTWFLNRDIKKEGLTKPRELLHAIFEVLEEAYPDLELDKYRHIYDGYYLIFPDETEIYLNRGHGLGMANSLTTLMQLGVFYMIQGRLVQEGFQNWSNMTCKAYNDDFYAAFDEEDTSELYAEHEIDVFDDLALKMEPRKSLIGPFSVLCENYSSPLGIKESYFRREILMSMACVNITMAKTYLSNLTKSVSPDLLEVYLPEIISYWGYEFCPDEIDQPFLCGGWVDRSYRGVSNDLKSLKESPFLLGLYRAGRDLNLPIPRKAIRVKKDEYYISPLERLYHIAELPDEAAEAIFNMGDAKKIGKNFIRLSSDSSHVRLAWEGLRLRRQKIFRENLEVATVGQVENEIINDYPEIDFIPNHTARAYEPCQVYNTFVPIEHLWEHLRCANPRIAYLKYVFPEKFSDRKNILPNPLPLLLGGGAIPTTDYRAETLYKSKWLDPSMRSEFRRSPRISKHILDTDSSAFKDAYLNPEMVIMYHALSATTMLVPSVIPEEKKLLKKLVKHWRFSVDELKLFGEIPYDHRMICRNKLGENLCDHEEIMWEIIASCQKEVSESEHSEVDPGEIDETILERYYHRGLEVSEEPHLVDTTLYIEDSEDYKDREFGENLFAEIVLTAYEYRDAELNRILKLYRNLFGLRMTTVAYLSDRWHRVQALQAEFDTAMIPYMPTEAEASEAESYEEDVWAFLGG
jgi:hypothetical protein